MTTLLILLTMLTHHADEHTHDLAAAIDIVCEDDRSCQLDAIATCWVETRCRGINKCGRNGCGPFQQVRRFTDIPELDGLSYEEKTRILGSDFVVATRQWLSKRNKYRARHGDRWPARYNGSENKERYLQRWVEARRWAESIQ